MTRKENIRAILECYFTGFKDVMIDSACERICELEQEPTAEKSVLDMTELEKALLHIKTRADAWAVKVVKDALSQEPCDKCVYSTKDGYCQYDDISETIPPLEPCADAVSRDAVINLFKGNIGSEAALILHKAKQLPSVNPQPCDDDGNNLCSSCTNIGCEFQSGIVRTKCAFYMPPHIETDNCGNYVVLSRYSEK